MWNRRPVEAASSKTSGEVVKADEGASGLQERLMDLHLPLVTHRQPVVASHTGATVFNAPDNLTWKTVACVRSAVLPPYRTRHRPFSTRCLPPRSARSQQRSERSPRGRADITDSLNPSLLPSWLGCRPLGSDPVGLGLDLFSLPSCSSL